MRTSSPIKLYRHVVVSWSAVDIRSVVLVRWIEFGVSVKIALILMCLVEDELVSGSQPLCFSGCVKTCFVNPYLIDNKS